MITYDSDDADNEMVFYGLTANAQYTVNEVVSDNQQENNVLGFIFNRGRFIIAVNPTEKAQDAPFEFEGECVFSIGEAKIGNKKISMLPQSLTVIKI